MKSNYPPLYYADYLKLDDLLSSQNPKSTEYLGELAHDEVLFIIVHQVYELWFKQILHELDSVVAIFRDGYVDENSMGIAVARIGRITEIQKLLIDQLRVLETMTPLDFLEFRDLLMPASGFQSYQFRLVENKLGLKSKQRQNFDQKAYFTRLSPEHQALVARAEKEPSLFTLVESWLERTPFLRLEGFDFWQHYQNAVHAALENNKNILRENPLLSDKEKRRELAAFTKTEAGFLALFNKEKHQALLRSGDRRLSYAATQAALLINLFRDEPILQMPFRFLTALIEVDELFTAWRHRHAQMVQRMIGTKVGTGGSSGHQYLQVTAERHKVFSDLTMLSNYLLPRSELPQLPKEFKKNLAFHYTVKNDENRPE